MPTEPRPPKTETRTGSQSRAGVETRTDNPPIKRSDGTYRPLDTEFIEEALAEIRESRRRNPEWAKRQEEFWRENSELDLF